MTKSRLTTVIAAVALLGVVGFLYAQQQLSTLREQRNSFAHAIADADQVLSDARTYFASIHRTAAIPIDERLEARFRCWRFFVRTSDISHSFQRAPEVRLETYWDFYRTMDETCKYVWWARPESATSIVLTEDERLSLEFAIEFFERLQIDLQAVRDDPTWNRNPTQSWIGLLRAWDATARELGHSRPWVKRQ